MTRLKQLPPELYAFAAGLLLFGVGLYGIWPPLAPLGVGVVLMWVSLFGPKRKSGGPE